METIKEEKKAEYTHCIFNWTVEELTRKFNDWYYRNFKIVWVIRREWLITVFFERED
jgi:hypothetical protein